MMRSSLLKTFPDRRRTIPLARSRLLFRLNELVEEKFEEISRIQTHERGKTIDESRGETRQGIENIEVACEPRYLVRYSK